jgi:DNA-binding transcriptional regulator GbsR (MarR family)
MPIPIDSSLISVFTEMSEMKMRKWKSLSDQQPPLLSPDKLRFIESIALYYENYGIPRIAGRMFGLLLLNTRPLSAEQISQILGASLSSVSTNIRALISNGWAEKVTLPGDRVTYYQFSPHAWEQVMERRRQSFAPLKAMADNMTSALPADDPARQQMQQLSDWASLLMQHYETLITTWQAQLAARTSQPPDETDA